jgi:hypothetical protein
VNAPWAPPGSYTVRLSASGKTSTQPLTLKLDPRVKTPPLALTQLTTLTREMYAGAKAARRAYDEARTLSAQLESAEGADAAALKKALDALAPPAPAGVGRGFGGGPGGGGAPGAGGGRGGATEAPTLNGVSTAMMAAAMGMQSAETAPTARDVAACTRARAQSAAVMARWTKLKAQAAAIK